ncbi:MAG TPA: ATP-dependent metallopeptidase FtsH/Yme1/Tma family protein, partial [Polyangiaceae bacterium]|nr:ATP-dependent metallopeptidase FtsH/Yme1/Tma family protein [Polyangiaceae bacterium]
MSDDPTSSPDPKPPERDQDGKSPWTSSGVLRWVVWLLPIALLFVVFTREDGAGTVTDEVPYTTFYRMVEEGRVERVTLRGTAVTAKVMSERGGDDRRMVRTRLPDQQDPSLLPMLRESGVEVVVQKAEPSTIWQLLGALLPWVLILGAWLYVSRRASNLMGGGGAPLGALRPGAKRFEAVEHVDVSFQDVAGCAPAKRDLREVVEFLKHPEKFRELGGKLPRGVLLVGSPGTGKTLLARAVAGEAGVPFFSISGSEFIELFVGVGASRVRDLFQAARQAAPAIIFIDEIDAVGRSRGTGLGGGHDEREQTLNQLLAAMDGFERSVQVVVMAATNRPDVLDPALLRPGRFDRRVVVDLPEVDAREAILEVHTRDKPLADDVDLREVAKSTPGFSGADLANIANEAALHALRRGADRIAREDFLAAEDKVQLGDPRETRLSPAEKRRVAVHEAGHALVAEKVATEPPRRVTIIPRGMALGATQQMPQGDRHLVTRSQLEARLRVLLGGYAAEGEVLGETSTGAEHDLRQAYGIAQKMVAVYGMSEALGPVHLEHRSEHPFLGARIATDGGVSDATVHEIEREARRLLELAREDAQRIVADERELLDGLVEALLERETLERDDLRAFFQPAPPSSQ